MTIDVRKAGEAFRKNNSPSDKLSVLNKLNVVMKCVFYWLLSIPSFRDIVTPHSLVIEKECFLHIKPHKSFKGEVVAEVVIQGQVTFSTHIQSASALMYVIKLFKDLLKDRRTLIHIIDNSDYLFYHFHDSVKGCAKYETVDALSLGVFNSLNPNQVANFYLYYLIRAFKNDPKCFQPEVYSSTYRREGSNEYKTWKVIIHPLKEDYYATLCYDSNTYSNHVLISHDFNWDFYKFDVVKMIKDLSLPDEVYQPLSEDYDKPDAIRDPK